MLVRDGVILGEDGRDWSVTAMIGWRGVGFVFENMRGV
jgi:hypothetical protein